MGSLSIRFGAGFNLVFGDHGSGKTALMHALVDGAWPYGGQAIVRGVGDRALMSAHWPVVMVDWRTGLGAGEARGVNHWTHLARKDQSILVKAEEFLNKAIQAKAGVAHTKFEGIPFQGPGTFALEVKDNGRVEVHAGPALLAVQHFSPYGSVEDLFVAAGEKFLLHLCGVLATRAHFELDVPLILDDILNGLDKSLRQAVLELIEAVPQQVIMTVAKSNLDITPDWLASAPRFQLPSP